MSISNSSRQRNPLLLLVIAIVALTASLSSCTVDNTSSSISGNWALEFIDGYPVYQQDIDYCELQLYYSGGGSYNYYDNFGYWSSMPITWDVDYSGYRDILYIYPANGQNPWVYEVDKSFNALALRDLVTNRRLTFYRF